MKKAFTLIEILLYFVILAVFLLTAVSFAIQILNVSQLSTHRHELGLSAQFITDKITVALQSAESVDGAGSTFDSDLGVLSLTMSDSLVSPTVFSNTNGNLTMKEGSGSVLTLNSSYVQVDSAEFHRIETAKTPDQIVVDLALSVVSDIPNTQAELAVHFTVSLRP